MSAHELPIDVVPDATTEWAVQICDLERHLAVLTVRTVPDWVAMAASRHPLDPTRATVWLRDDANRAVGRLDVQVPPKTRLVAGAPRNSRNVIIVDWRPED